MKKRAPIYLDYAAHTPCSKKSLEVLVQTSSFEFGNPSATHPWGMKSHEILRSARGWFADHFSVTPDQVIFTSGGTEANNLAILGILMRKDLSKQHAITTTVEHPSVANLYAQLEKKGLSVTYLNVNHDGLISLDELVPMITPRTTLISLIGVNNEIGTIAQLFDVGTAIKKANPATLFHVDGVQAFGKIHLPLADDRIDLLSLSAHKLHGPTGVGALILAHDLPLVPQMIGGEQEKGKRAGTENLPAIAAFAYAARDAIDNLEVNFKHARSLWDRCREKLDSLSSRIRIHSPHDGSPYILNFSIEGMPSEVSLRRLGEEGMGLSAGAACSSRGSNNRILSAIGVPQNISACGLRVSFSSLTHKNDIDSLISAVKQQLEVR